MEFLLALQFLTRIPINIKGHVDEKTLARSMAYYPLSGLVIGTMAAAFYIGLSFLLPTPICDVFVIAFIIFITGNMHGDALMDTADGFFSGKPRERILEIMKDSRVGANGVMAGCLIVLTKFVLLGQIPLVAKGLTLILVPTLGRWVLVYGSALYPYARADGGTGHFTQHVGTRELFWASLTGLAVSLLLLGPKGLIPLAVVLIGGIMLSKYVVTKIQGVTGDTLGALTELTEVLALTALVVVMNPI